MSKKKQLKVYNEDEMKKNKARLRLRHKIIYQWGIPIAVGIFSFIYWFLLLPFAFSSLPVRPEGINFRNWAIVGPIAFFIWLIIVGPFFWLWVHKQKTFIEVPPPVKDQCEYPLYPTKTTTVQPVVEAKHSPCNRSQDSSVWIPVQPGNVTPSLYNAQTGRDSFQSDYRLDEVPEKSSADEIKPITRNNSGVQLVKKLDPGNHTSNSHRLISVSSSSSTETGGLDFNKIQRDPGDGLDSRESEKQSFHALDGVNGSIGMTEAVIEAQKSRLERDESFKGLPDMQNFGEYLHLVTVDTPMSPRDVFFSELAPSESTKDEVEVQTRQRNSYHPRRELNEAQRRITEARKSLPPLFHYPDLEMGEPRVLKTTTLPPQTVLRLEDEQVHKPSYLRSISEGQKRCWGTAAPRPKTSGEYFVADCARLESITSEVQMTVQPDLSESCHISRWETKQSSIAVSPSSMENSPKRIQVSVNPIEGRWVILSKDYASNNIEAFIRIEQEAMNRERAAPRLASEDTDNDSVFLELDQ